MDWWTRKACPQCGSEGPQGDRKLSQLGARVREIVATSYPTMRNQGMCGKPFADAESMLAIFQAMRELGLVPQPIPEEERLTPIDEERESFHRQTIERFERGEIP